MGSNTRRLLAVPLLTLAVGPALVVAPTAAQAAGVAATVEVRSTLKLRSGPSLASKVVGTLRNGRRVTVICGVTGQTVRGSVRTTNQWDRLSTGAYVTDAYVSSAKRIPRCAVPAGAAVKAKPKPSRHDHRDLQDRHRAQLGRRGQHPHRAVDDRAGEAHGRHRRHGAGRVRRGRARWSTARSGRPPSGTG